MATNAVEAPGSGIVTSTQIDYKQHLFSNARYRHVQINPNTFGQTITLNNSQTPVVYTLPVDVMNFAESYINLQIKLPAPTAGYYTWFYNNAFSGAISQIQHYVDTNQYTANIDQLQNYMSVILPKELSFNEANSLDSSAGFFVNNAPTGASYTDSNNNLNTENFSLRFSLPKTVGDNYPDRYFLEPSYFGVSKNTAQDVVLTYTLPLRLIKNSIFSVDKDLYFGKASYLKLYFGPISKICYMSTVGNDPSDASIAAYAANAGTPSITVNTLYLALENSEQTRQLVMNQVLSPGGLSMYIPYIQSYKNSNNGSTQNISIQSDVGNGQSLSKIIHTVWNNNETLDTAYDHSNCDQLSQLAANPYSKIKNYYTQLNGKRIQDLTLDCTSVLNGNGGTSIFSDYMYHRKMLIGSVLQTRNMYQWNFFHCDDFSQFGSKADQDSRTDLIAGIPLTSAPLTWSFVGLTMGTSTPDGAGGTTSSYNHYTWMVYNKKLTMQSTLTTVV